MCYLKLKNCCYPFKMEILFLSLKEKAMLLSLRLSVPIVASLWAPEKINEIKIEWSCSFSLLEDT